MSQAKKFLNKLIDLLKNKKYLVIVGVIVTIILSITIIGLISASTVANLEDRALINRKKYIYPIYRFGYYGFIDQTGTIIIQAIYKNLEIRPYGVDELIPIQFELDEKDSTKDRYGYINSLGQTIIEPNYYKAYRFIDGIARIQNTIEEFDAGLSSFINPTGRTILETRKYGAYSNSMINYDSGDQTNTYINSKGEIKLINLRFDPDLEEGFYNNYLTINNQLYNREGELVTTSEYEELGELSEDLIAVSQGQKMGFIDYTGKLIIPLIYDLATYDIYKDLQPSTGTDVDPKFNKYGDSIGDFRFREGLVRVRLGNKYHFINKQNQIIIENVGVPILGNSNQALNNSFYQGLAIKVVRENDKEKCGYINKKGKEVIPLKFLICNVFLGDLTLVEGKYIDQTGTDIKDFTYDT